jgi:hypothetical protein
MSTGPGIDAIGPQIATDEINNIATKLSRNSSSSVSLDMEFSLFAWLATQPALLVGRYLIATNTLQRHLSEPSDWPIPPLAALHHRAWYSITILRRDNLRGVADKPNLKLQTGVMIFSLGGTPRPGELME